MEIDSSNTAQNRKRLREQVEEEKQFQPLGIRRRPNILDYSTFLETASSSRANVQEFAVLPELVNIVGEYSEGICDELTEFGGQCFRSNRKYTSNNATSNCDGYCTIHWSQWLLPYLTTFVGDLTIIRGENIVASAVYSFVESGISFALSTSPEQKSKIMSFASLPASMSFDGEGVGDARHPAYTSLSIDLHFLKHFPSNSANVLQFINSLFSTYWRLLHDLLTQIPPLAFKENGIYSAVGPDETGGYYTLDNLPPLQQFLSDRIYEFTTNTAQREPLYHFETELAHHNNDEIRVIVRTSIQTAILAIVSLVRDLYEPSSLILSAETVNSLVPLKAVPVNDYYFVYPIDWDGIFDSSIVPPRDNTSFKKYKDGEIKGDRTFAVTI